MPISVMPLAALPSGRADILSGIGRSFDGSAAGPDTDPVLAWNQRALDAIEAEAATPLFASRVLAIESIAVLAVLAVVEAVDTAPAARLAGPEALDAISTTL